MPSSQISLLLRLIELIQLSDSYGDFSFRITFDNQDDIKRALDLILEYNTKNYLQIKMTVKNFTVFFKPET